MPVKREGEEPMTAGDSYRVTAHYNLLKKPVINEAAAVGRCALFYTVDIIKPAEQGDLALHCTYL